jgi:hypothetical protein
MKPQRVLPPTLLLVTLTLSFGTHPASAAAPKAGNQCKRSLVGQTVSGLTCQKSGTKYVWTKAPSQLPLAPSQPSPGAGPGGDCHPSYDPCIAPRGGDVDCASGSGNGPRYVVGPVKVTGTDEYGLDRDGDGIGCEKR